MKPERIALLIAWIGMAGYAFFAAATIAASQLMYGIALAGFLAYYFITEKKDRIVWPPVLILIVMGLYTAWRLAALLVNSADLMFFKEEWLFGMVIIGAALFRDMKRLTTVLDFFAAGVILMGAYGIWQHFYGVDLYHKVLLDKMVFGYRAIGNFSTYLTFSGFFAVTSIFFVPIAFFALHKIRKFYYILASQIGLVCILFNYSRSTIVAIVIGIVLLVLLIGPRYRKWATLALLITLVVALVVSPDFLARFKNIPNSELSAAGANSRFAIWQTSLMMIKEKPLFGIGAGNFHEKYRELRENRRGKNLSHAHNDILNVAAESGIICSLLYLMMWGLIVGSIFRGFLKCPDGFQKSLLLGAVLASVVFFMMAQFEAFFADEEVRLLLMFIWGVGLAVLGNMKASERLSEIA